MYTSSMETIYLSLVHTGSWGNLFHEIPSISTIFIIVCITSLSFFGYPLSWSTTASTDLNVVVLYPSFSGNCWHIHYQKIKSSKKLLQENKFWKILLFWVKTNVHLKTEIQLKSLSNMKNWSKNLRESSKIVNFILNIR